MVLYSAPVPGNSEPGISQRFFFSALGCGQECQFPWPKSCHLNCCTAFPPDLMSLWDGEGKSIGMEAKIENLLWIAAQCPMQSLEHHNSLPRAISSSNSFICFTKLSFSRVVISR